MFVGVLCFSSAAQAACLNVLQAGTTNLCIDYAPNSKDYILTEKIDAVYAVKLTIDGNIMALEGNDSINFSGAVFNGSIDGGDGDDRISSLVALGDTETKESIIKGNVIAGTGKDELYFARVQVDGSVYLGNVEGTTYDEATAFLGGSLMANFLHADNSTIAGIVHGDRSADYVQLVGGSVGGIALGEGSDYLTLRYYTFTDGVLDGGDDASMTDGSFDDLRSMDSNMTIAGENLRNWERISKLRGSLILTGSMLVTGTGFSADGRRAGLSNNGGDIHIKSKNFMIKGDVYNPSVLHLSDAVGQKLVIDGNYSGDGQINIKTVLGGDNSVTDQVHVTGNTSGNNKLLVTNEGGLGAYSTEGIRVIQVDGVSDAVFTLRSPVQTGSYEYILVKNGLSTPTDGDWYLRSTVLASCENTPSLCATNSGSSTGGAAPSAVSVRLYRPGVAAYVAAQSANADVSYSLLSTLHQRMGAQTKFLDETKQTWGRVFASGEDSRGLGRFDYKQTSTGFQFGHDLLKKENSNGTQQRAGVTAQYANGLSDMQDRVRPLANLDLDVGSNHSTHYGLGGYYTRIADNGDGLYLDVVGQINRLRNKFSDAYGASSKQNAWQAGLSVEVGKPVARVWGWNIEPQAQLSVLHTRYAGFSDAQSSIDGFNASNVRARLGVRLNTQLLDDKFEFKGASAHYYGLLNINHDLLKPKTVSLHDLNSSDSAFVDESFDQTFAEVGFGIQGRLTHSTYVYADARYERSFKGNKDSGTFNLGVKTSF